jgi:DNA-binding response OmpR family regulator
MHNEESHRKNAVASAEVEPDYSCLAEKSVLVVDDEQGVVEAVMEGLGKNIMGIECATDGSSALDMIMDNDYDLILLDIRMPGMNGMELYKRISASKPYLAQRIIFLTGDIESESTRSFLKLTGCRFLAKPFTMDELLSVMYEERLTGGPVVTGAQIDVAADTP